MSPPVHPEVAQPALTVALALAAGMVGQVLARHLRIPGIVVLLALGVVLGSDVLGWIAPESLGGALETIVGFAVAVILFEGGLGLEWRRLARQARAIRGLVSVGAVVTALGGTLTGLLVLGWEWQRALLFGTLVVVTGPTVVTPILRRIKLRRKLSTVLEAEGVFIDAIGAILAVVALEVVLSPVRGGTVGTALWTFALRLGGGAALGALGGALILLLLRPRHLIPEGLENVFAFSIVLALFQGANTLLEESGIVAVVAAGLLVGNVRHRGLDDLKEFKEQLTVLLIGLLFVLLAADVRVADVRSLGWPGIAAVACLIFLVRPATVAVGTVGSDLTRRERLFAAWLAPRGIVAAAVASLFAERLGHAGIPGGEELRAMVFLVIAATVLLQGSTGGLLARWLGLRRPSHVGWAILGAHALGRALGGALRAAGEEVVLLDASSGEVLAAQEEDFRVLHGSALSESVQRRAELEDRRGVVAMTPNDEVNLLFATAAREEHRVTDVWIGLRRGRRSVTMEMVHDLGARTLFGGPRHSDRWSLRLERGDARVEVWRATAGARLPGDGGDGDDEVLPLVLRSGGTARPVDGTSAPRQGDELAVVVPVGEREDAVAWLTEGGWEAIGPLPGEWADEPGSDGDAEARVGEG